MSVEYFGGGDLSNGFVGFGVRRSVGAVPRRKSFSLREYSFAEAEKLAYELDEHWRREAVEAKRIGKMNRRRKMPNIIAEGLKGHIQVDKGRYFTPGFVVTPPGGAGKMFRTTVHGYESRIFLPV